MADVSTEVKKAVDSPWVIFFFGVLLGATILLGPTIAIVAWFKSKLQATNTPANAATDNSSVLS